MVEVEKMSEADSKSFLQRLSYGQPGLAHEPNPYVVPIHYAYNEPHVYIYTTQCIKTGIIENNPKVCLQVEEVKEGNHRQSVIITGDAVQVTDSEEIKSAKNFILAADPKSTPALKIHWIANQWVRSHVKVVYRITPTTITAYRTVERLSHKD